MTYAPPPPGHGFPSEMIQPRKTSGVAIAALVVSLLFCIPFIPSAIAVLLGVIGLFTASRPNRKGTPLAVIGIVLGVLGVLLWGYGTFVVYARFGMPIMQGIAFSEKLQLNDFAGAAKFTTPPFNPDELPGLVDRIRTLGAYQSVTDFEPIPTTPKPGVREFAFKARAVFANGVQDIEMGFIELPEGWRVTRLKLSDPAGLTPSTQSTAPATTNPAP